MSCAIAWNKEQEASPLTFYTKNFSSLRHLIISVVSWLRLNKRSAHLCACFHKITYAIHMKMCLLKNFNSFLKKSLYRVLKELLPDKHINYWILIFDLKVNDMQISEKNFNIKFMNFTKFKRIRSKFKLNLSKFKIIQVNSIWEVDLNAERELFHV